MAEPMTPPEQDVLKTPSEEAREMEQFLAAAQNAHVRVGWLTLLGVLLLASLVMYFGRFDYARDNGRWQKFPSILSTLVENQTAKDRQTYVTRKGAESFVPVWPERMYLKLRLDMFLAGGVVLLMSLVFLLSEKAKLQRNDLLVFRAMAREIERLRQRVKALESPSAAASAPAGDPSGKPTERSGECGCSCCGGAEPSGPASQPASPDPSASPEESDPHA